MRVTFVILIKMRHELALFLCEHCKIETAKGKTVEQNIGVVKLKVRLALSIVNKTEQTKLERNRTNSDFVILAKCR